MHYADTHTPVPIMGASCLVFSLLVLPLSCLWVHTVSIASRRAEEVDTDESENRRPILSGGKKKVEPPALLSLSHFLSLSLSLSCTLSLEAELKWVASTPYCITHYNDCCSDSVVPNPSLRTSVASDREIWESLRVSKSEIKISVVSSDFKKSDKNQCGFTEVRWWWWFCLRAAMRLWSRGNRYARCPFCLSLTIVLCPAHDIWVRCWQALMLYEGINNSWVPSDFCNIE